MPRYDFECDGCSHIQEESMKIAELDTRVIECEKCGTAMHQTFRTVNHAFMAPEALGRKKAPGDFRNFLSAIKKAHPGSSIRDH